MEALAIRGCTEILKCIFQRATEAFAVTLGKLTLIKQNITSI